MPYKPSSSKDTGPQIPTIVSHMLKYGTNLLQAVGEFNGNYIVAVVFMSIKPTPDPATLLNYVQPTPASVDPAHLTCCIAYCSHQNVKFVPVVDVIF